MPHVLYELSYIRKNLLERIPLPLFFIVMILLLILIISKIINLITPITIILNIEIIVVISLLIATLYFRTSLFMATIVLLLCIGFILNPFILLIALAFLHNLTPWGFLSLNQNKIKAWVIFLIYPVLVFFAALILAIDPSYIASENAITYLSHYLLTPRLSSLNLAFFATAVYLQMVHYYCVLRVLPKISTVKIQSSSAQLIVFGLAGIGFFTFFNHGKSLYGIIALFHAYLEIPILLYLLMVKKQTSAPQSLKIFS